MVQSVANISVTFPLLSDLPLDAPGGFQTEKNLAQV